MASTRASRWSRNALAAALAACVLSVAPAFAGECPADQIAKGTRTSGETMAKDVKDEVISQVDLSSKGEAFDGYLLRMRRLEIAPGGVVPWHMHDVRAANILIQEGTIIEYSSNCKVGIEHKTGDVVAEFGADLAHWWKNESDKPVVIISSDLLPPSMPEPETM